MDWSCFFAAFWAVVLLWLLPRGVSAVFAAVKAMAS